MLSLSEKYDYFRIKILNGIFDHIKVSIFIYVHLKYFLGKKVNNLILILLTVLLSPILFLTIWTLKLVKGIVHLWLAFKEGNDFVEMLDGTDAYFMVYNNPKERDINTILLMVEFDGDGEAFGQKVKDEIIAVFSGERFLKLRCSVVQNLGYYYFRQSYWPINSHFKPLSGDSSNGAMAMELLRQIISKISNELMPCNDTALWEVRIGERPLEGSGKCVYPLVFRFHHVVGDGATIFNMFSGEFQTRCLPRIVKDATKLRYLDDRFTKIPFISKSDFTETLDNNVLCQTNGKKHVVWHIEETPQMLNIIKEMKAQLKNDITFVDIILTCFLESFENYFTKQENSYPNSILVEVPLMPPDYNFKAYGKSDYKLNNKMSWGFLRLPLKLHSHEQRLLQRLELIRQEYDVVKNKSLDVMVNAWTVKELFTIFPHYLLKWFLNQSVLSLCVSNIPGCSSLKCFGGLKVKEFIFVGANESLSGVTFMISSYENRLYFVYTIDSAVIANVEDLKAISANFIHNFNKLSDIINANN